MLKNLVKDLKPSSTLAINETSKQLEQQGKKIFKFGFGQSPFKVPEDIVEELKSNAYQNKYLPMQGLEELREAVAKYSSKKKNYNYKAKNVIIGPGSKELMFLLHIIFDGEIILPAPSWVSYAPQAILGRNKIQILQTERENNWFPTGAQIEKIISKDKDKNYLLFLNSPNNPSGQVCNKLEEISEIAKKYNLIILSDEIYSELTFSKNFKSISSYCPEKTIISTGLSKWCGAGGWRLGYFIIPDELNNIKNMINVLAEGYVNENDVFIRPGDNGYDPSGQNLIERIDSRGDFKLSSGLMIAIGKTFKSGKMNFPLNFFAIPPAKGNSWRIGISTGFNIIQKKVRPIVN